MKLITYLQSRLNYLVEKANHRALIPKKLRTFFKLEYLKIGKTNVVGIYLNNDNFKIKDVQSFIRTFNSTEYELMLILEEVNPYQRGVLIENEIGFIVVDKEIHLPFLFYSYRKKQQQMKKKSPTIMIEPFSPSEQLIMFYFMYKPNTYIRRTELIHALKIATTTASKALVKLESLQFIESIGEGPSREYRLADSFSNVFLKIIRFLIVPYKKKILLTLDQASLLFEAGELALMSYTNLISNVEEYAVYKKEINNLQESSNGQEYLVEEWLYNPAPLTKVINEIGISNGTNIVDPLSLFAKYTYTREDVDERVILELEEMISKLRKRFDKT